LPDQNFRRRRQPVKNLKKNDFPAFGPVFCRRKNNLKDFRSACVVDGSTVWRGDAKFNGIAVSLKAVKKALYTSPAPAGQRDFRVEGILDGAGIRLK